jgi:hypothetical protein
LDDKEVVRAMRLLYPDASPTLVPDEEKEKVGTSAAAITVATCCGVPITFPSSNACMTVRSISVSCFWDGEFDVRLGDAINGFVAQDKVRTWEEAAPWLRAQALFHHPNSGFAKGELGTDWKRTDTPPTKRTQAARRP